MKPKIHVRFISNLETLLGFASATRTLVSVAILSIAGALCWGIGVAAETGPPVFSQNSKFVSPIGALAVEPHDNFEVLTGETITVTTLNDVSDFSGSQQVSDLPGPDGRISFREACTAANNTPGPQTIAFAIPVTEFWLTTDVALLKLEQGAFILTDSDTTVDFSTQTVNIGDTNPTGPEVGIYGLQPNGAGVAAIFVKGDNSVIKGLGLIYQRGYGVEISGDNNRVIGSRITGAYNAAVSIEGYLDGPIPMGNIVGGTAPGEANYMTGLTIRGPAEDNIVIGNTIIGGVDVIGSTQYGVIVRNNRIGGPTAAERNVIAGAGHYSSEGYPVGEQVSVVDADGTIIEGNYIGTTVDGMARYPQQVGAVGVEVRDSRGTTVRGNLIAGLRSVGVNHYNGQIFGQAVYVGATNGDTNDTVIESNTIGLAADGVTLIVTRSGVIVSPMTENYHAFGTRIASNHIAGVETRGIVIGSNENGVTLTGNSIHDSGLLGIDLFYNFNGIGGVTLNDAGDGDVGGNGLQNFPVLLSAKTTGSALTVQGTLDSSPSAQFTIEFFASPLCNPLGYGEGALFLGSTPVTTDTAGHAAFSASLTAAVPVGRVATATATRLSTGDTSEFSACVAVTAAVPPTPTPTSPTAFDYDADGKADISLYRSSNSAWYVQRSTEGFYGIVFGDVKDKIAPADYDGDGKADMAIYRPSESNWYILNSGNGIVTVQHFGLAADMPVPGDFDGDGKADVNLFRPSDGTWYRLNSSNGAFVANQFGSNGDKPQAGDFDGDHKADIAVFKPADGAWFWIRSSDGVVAAINWGLSTDLPVPADYEGDGKTDVAIYRPSQGGWYILKSSDGGFMGQSLGLVSDIPAPADYDGDGRANVAIFRPSDGNWWINRTTAGVTVFTFGVNGDKPTPSAFIY